MLTIKNVKIEPITFHLEEGDVTHVLQLVPMTIADRFELIRLQQEIVSDEKLNDNVKSALLLVSRLIVSIKNMDGEQHFKCEPKDIYSVLSADAIIQLNAECSKVNPIEMGSLEESKK